MTQGSAAAAASEAEVTRLTSYLPGGEIYDAGQSVEYVSGGVVGTEANATEHIRLLPLPFVIDQPCYLLISMLGFTR